MTKTVIVEVVRTHAHWLYQKTIRRARRFAAHNTIEGVLVGDVVKITEVRPMSKTKHFVVVEKQKSQKQNEQNK
ncbi:mitochondrial small ribosomal subunit protein uS17m [Candidatus Gottesmanbacteria bacterium]|nr:mitochondrial small ribosomal subunit protein uS17m [Candidatus Gottesmanbacteria bacterium]